MSGLRDIVLGREENKPLVPLEACAGRRPVLRLLEERARFREEVYPGWRAERNAGCGASGLQAGDEVALSAPPPVPSLLPLSTRDRVLAPPGATDAARPPVHPACRVRGQAIYHSAAAACSRIARRAPGAAVGEFEPLREAGRRDQFRGQIHQAQRRSPEAGSMVWRPAGTQTVSPSRAGHGLPVHQRRPLPADAHAVRATSTVACLAVALAAFHAAAAEASQGTSGPGSNSRSTGPRAEKPARPG